jgi:DNA transformation protein
MSPLSSFAQHAVDLLSPVGPVKARSMFGGYGLSLNGVSIGLIDEDRIYLRVDDVTRGEFERAGGTPFVYPSKKGPMTMKNYFALPEDAVDDSELAARWGKLAAEAGRRAEAAKSSKRKAAPPTAKAKDAKKPKKAKAKAKPAARARSR